MSVSTVTLVDEPVKNVLLKSKLRTNVLRILAITYCFFCVYANSVNQSHLDFNLYYAGAQVERAHTTFDNQKAVQGKLIEDHLYREPTHAPFPYGTVSLIALVFVPLSFLPASVALFIFLAVAIALLAWAAFRISRFWTPFVFLLLFYSLPVVKSFQLANWSLIAAALLLHTYLDLKEGKRVRPGIFLGITIAMKFYPAFLLFPLIIKREYRAAIYGVASTVLMAAVSALIVGFHDFLHDVGVSFHSGVTGKDFFSNMGLPGIFVSLTRNTHVLYAASTILVLLSLFVLYRFRSFPVEWLFALSLALLTLISPLTWDHYFSLAVVIELLVVCDWNRLSNRWRATLVAATVFCWLPWSYVPRGFFGILPHAYFPSLFIQVRPIYAVAVFLLIFLGPHRKKASISL
jgi:hypothetical protein